MNELLFTGMDILKQTRKLVENTTDQACSGLTDAERAAYLGGVANTLSILDALLQLDEEPVVHIPNFNNIEEMAIGELEEIFLD